MRTHHVWTWFVTIVVAITFGDAWAQTPLGTLPYERVSGGGAFVYADACGACGGAGCGICGRPRFDGRRLASAVANLGLFRGCNSSDCQGCSSCNVPQLGWGGYGGAEWGPALLPALHAGYPGYGSQHVGQGNGPSCRAGCCRPMWYDVHVEFMYLTRYRISDRVDFTSRNVSGSIVLSTDDLSFNEASGFRATYAFLVGPSTNIEASYFGTHNWADSATVTGAADLFSVFSDFGTQPVGGFPQTDAADVHGIAYSSELHNGEINLRHRWVSANCLLHGSRLLGVRYIALDEDFTHFTRVAGGGSLDYLDTTRNDLYGLQIGTDLHLCVSPRFKLGAEVEAGVYVNRATADTVAVTDTPTVLLESESDTDVAFAGEASLIGLFNVTPRFNIRGGYQVLYLEGVALAAENFNTQSPFSSRPSFIDNNGNVFYHGATLGFEWIW